MPESNGRLTNKDLTTLLVHLGFEAGEQTERFRRVWRHSEAGTVLLLPSNRTLEPVLEVDFISVRAHLEYNGHLDAEAFDEFVRTERLPVVS